MIPGMFNLTGDQAVYKGDSYRAIEAITLPDLSPFDGPEDLVGATVSAQIRDEAENLLGAFDVEILDAAERRVRPTMPSSVTTDLPATSGSVKAYWDLQVEKDGWVGTPLRGKVKIFRQETF